MGNEEFLRICKAKVCDYFNEHADKTDGKMLTVQDVFVVWSCKTLQNNKALLSTNVSDGMYYELTYNGDKHELYFDAYKKWGADLVLSGHLHGGIIRLPGIGGLITPQAIPFPKYSGEMTTEGEQTIIVSRGLGTHTINLRFLNEAEMIVIHLRGEKDS